MGTTLRLASLVVVALIFGFKPTEVRSLYVDPKHQLSNWHPADQVPCFMYVFTSSDGCQCVTLLERPLITAYVIDP